MDKDVETLLSVRDLTIAFAPAHRPRVEAVRKVSFDIATDRTVALVGESGSGKSMSALAIMGLLPSSAQVSGSIWFRGQDLFSLGERAMRQRRGREISIIFQEPMTSLNPVARVGAQVAEVLRVHDMASGAGVMRRVVELFHEVGIPDPEFRARSYPHQLSGGQQQRVMIAIAIACNPVLLIADEPTTALDVTIQKQILELLARLRRSYKMSMLFISHDLGAVSGVADEVLVMRHGEIRERGEVADVFQQPKDAYTQALLACRPSVSTRPWRLPVVADFMREDAVASPNREREPRSDGEVVLEVKGIAKTFRLRTGFFSSRSIEAVKNVSFVLRRGRTLGLVGESGSGKTTIGLTVMRLHEVSQGEVWLNGSGERRDVVAMMPRELLAARRRLQIVFQDPFASLNPRFTVGQTLLEPMRIHGIGADDHERVGQAEIWLERVGLGSEALQRYPHEFSGGQRQRIAIARCLTLKPDVLICDESVSALDVSVQAQVLNLLLDLQDEFGLSYLFISHDLAVVRFIADQIMVMHAGEIVEVGDAEQIYRAPSHAYTRSLIAAIPDVRRQLGAAISQPSP